LLAETGVDALLAASRADDGEPDDNEAAGGDEGDDEGEE
jgi:hypothetical protein